MAKIGTTGNRVRLLLPLLCYLLLVPLVVGFVTAFQIRNQKNNAVQTSSYKNCRSKVYMTSPSLDDAVILGTKAFQVLIDTGPIGLPIAGLAAAFLLSKTGLQQQKELRTEVEQVQINIVKKSDEAAMAGKYLIAISVVSTILSIGNVVTMLPRTDGTLVPNTNNQVVVRKQIVAPSVPNQNTNVVAIKPVPFDTFITIRENDESINDVVKETKKETLTTTNLQTITVHDNDDNKETEKETITKNLQTIDVHDNYDNKETEKETIIKNTIVKNLQTINVHDNDDNKESEKEAITTNLQTINIHNNDNNKEIEKEAIATNLQTINIHYGDDNTVTVLDDVKSSKSVNSNKSPSDDTVVDVGDDKDVIGSIDHDKSKVTDTTGKLLQQDNIVVLPFTMPNAQMDKVTTTKDAYTNMLQRYRVEKPASKMMESFIKECRAVVIVWVEWLQVVVERIMEWVQVVVERLMEWAPVAVERITEWVPVVVERIMEWVPVVVERLMVWVPVVVDRIINDPMTLSFSSQIQDTIRMIEISVQVVNDRLPSDSQPFFKGFLVGTLLLNVVNEGQKYKDDVYKMSSVDKKQIPVYIDEQSQIDNNQTLLTFSQPLIEEPEIQVDVTSKSLEEDDGPIVGEVRALAEVLITKRIVKQLLQKKQERQKPYFASSIITEINNQNSIIPQPPSEKPPIELFDTDIRKIAERAQNVNWNQAVLPPWSPLFLRESVRERKESTVFPLNSENNEVKTNAFMSWFSNITKSLPNPATDKTVDTNSGVVTSPKTRPSSGRTAPFDVNTYSSRSKPFVGNRPAASDSSFVPRNKNFRNEFTKDYDFITPSAADKIFDSDVSSSRVGSNADEVFISSQISGEHVEQPPPTTSTPKPQANVETGSFTNLDIYPIQFDDDRPTTDQSIKTNARIEPFSAPVSNDSIKSGFQWQPPDTKRTSYSTPRDGNFKNDDSKKVEFKSAFNTNDNRVARFDGNNPGIDNASASSTEPPSKFDFTSPIENEATFSALNIYGSEPTPDRDAGAKDPTNRKPPDQPTFSMLNIYKFPDQTPVDNSLIDEPRNFEFPGAPEAEPTFSALNIYGEPSSGSPTGNILATDGKFRPQEYVEPTFSALDIYSVQPVSNDVSSASKVDKFYTYPNAQPIINPSELYNAPINKNSEIPAPMTIDSNSSTKTSFDVTDSYIETTPLQPQEYVEPAFGTGTLNVYSVAPVSNDVSSASKPNKSNIYPDAQPNINPPKIYNIPANKNNENLVLGTAFGTGTLDVYSVAPVSNDVSSASKPNKSSMYPDTQPNLNPPEIYNIPANENNENPVLGAAFGTGTLDVYSVAPVSNDVSSASKPDKSYIYPDTQPNINPQKIYNIPANENNETPVPLTFDSNLSTGSSFDLTDFFNENNSLQDSENIVESQEAVNIPIADILPPNFEVDIDASGSSSANPYENINMFSILPDMNDLFSSRPSYTPYPTRQPDQARRNDLARDAIDTPVDINPTYPDKNDSLILPVRVSNLNESTIDTLSLDQSAEKITEHEVQDDAKDLTIHAIDAIIDSNSTSRDNSSLDQPVEEITEHEVQDDDAKDLTIYAIDATIESNSTSRDISSLDQPAEEITEQVQDDDAKDLTLYAIDIATGIDSNATSRDNLDSLVLSRAEVLQPSHSDELQTDNVTSTNEGSESQEIIEDVEHDKENDLIIINATDTATDSTNPPLQLDIKNDSSILSARNVIRSSNSNDESTLDDPLLTDIDSDNTNNTNNKELNDFIWDEEPFQ